MLETKTAESDNNSFENNAKNFRISTTGYRAYEYKVEGDQEWTMAQPKIAQEYGICEEIVAVKDAQSDEWLCLSERGNKEKHCRLCRKGVRVISGIKTNLTIQVNYKPLHACQHTICRPSYCIRISLDVGVTDISWCTSEFDTYASKIAVPEFLITPPLAVKMDIATNAGGENINLPMYIVNISDSVLTFPVAYQTCPHSTLLLQKNNSPSSLFLLSRVAVGETEFHNLTEKYALEQKHITINKIALMYKRI